MLHHGRKVPANLIAAPFALEVHIQMNGRRHIAAVRHIDQGFRLRNAKETAQRLAIDQLDALSVFKIDVDRLHASRTTGRR